MPIETQQAVDWALTQQYVDPVMGDVYDITKDTPQALVDKVCEYFDANYIEYSTFSYGDLILYL